MNRSCMIRSVAWAAATLCASLAGAQTQPSPDTPADRPLPAVHVTGSAIRQIDAETALPVIVLRRADIDRSGARTTTELLQQLPVMQGMVQTSAVVGTDSRGYASLSVHNLGDVYTLVLLNGQRVAPFGGQLSNGALSGVDINTIPLAMVDRIEVLSDGASALYGADALGGVVNIITRRDGDINEAAVGVTWPRGGAREAHLSAFKNVGKLEETGQSLSLGLSAMHRTALSAPARDYAREAFHDFTHQGQRYLLADVQDAGAPGTIYYNFAGPIQSLNPALQATGRCPAGSYLYNNPFDPLFNFPLCSYNYAADIDLVPEQTQHSLMASYTRQFAPDSTLQLDLLLSRSVVSSHLAPVATRSDGLYLFSPSPGYDNYLAGLNLDNPVNLSYRFVDLGRRGFEDTSDLAHLAGRMDGRLNAWSWSAGLQHSVSSLHSDISHAMNDATQQRLLDNGLVNYLVGPGQQSASDLAAQTAATYNGRWLGGRSTLTELQWQASRDLMSLPGGPIKWSLGVNVRREQLSFSPSLFAQGLLSDLSPGAAAGSFDQTNLRVGDPVPMQSSSASRYVWGAFSEWLTPLTPALEWGAALRTDHDELVGQAWTGKTTARWRPSPGVLWRASLGTGFRAPSLNQLRSPGGSGGDTGKPYDCTSDLQALAASLGAAPCASTSKYSIVVGGNADLQPEKSVQANVGFRLEPSAAYVLGADLWAVQIRDRIGSVDADVAFHNPLKVPSSTWTTVDTGSGPQLVLQGRPHNLGTLMSSGLDLLAGARRSTAVGVIDSQLRATVMLREDSPLYPGGPWSSAIGDGFNGAPTLKWRANWRTSLISAGWTHSLTARYQSGYRDGPVDAYPLDADGQPSGPAQTIRLKVASQVLWDWQSSWQINGSLQLTAGVINIFDTKPPLALGGSGAYKGQMTGYDERYFDARGRMLTVEAKLSF